jgi:hypothetical protein
MKNELSPGEVAIRGREICLAVNDLEQKVCHLRDYLDFGISGKRGLRGLPVPERSLAYSRDILKSIIENIEEMENYQTSDEYHQRTTPYLPDFSKLGLGSFKTETGCV